MKKFLSILLTLTLLLTFTLPNGVSFAEEAGDFDLDFTPDFNSCSDPAFLQYVEDITLASFEASADTDQYTVNAVQAIYISQEYIDELAYNSQMNIFFGYTLEEIEAQFCGTKYVFTLGEDMETTVQAFEPYDDSAGLETVLKNVAIGAGVILVCVTVTVLTSGTGAPMVVQVIHAIAASAARMAIIEAAKGTVTGAATAAMLTYNETGDISETLRSAAVGASEGFKWGAIYGAVEGAAYGAIGFATQAIRTPYASEARALELFGGSNQVSFLDGELVTYGTTGSTRPDILRQLADGTLEAIEVKNYNLESGPSVRELITTLVKEISDRKTHMPEGSLQRVVLDVAGRGYTEKHVEIIIELIQAALSVIYPDIPVDVIWY